MPTKRRIRRPAKPLPALGSGVRGRFQRFFTSFKPKNFKAYWLSRAGLVRLAKIAGAGVLFIFLVFLWYAKDLPSPSKINSKLGLTTTFYARDAIDAQGNVDYTHATKLYEVHGDENRIVIDFNQMPADLKNATVAIEDRNFYKHGAFSFVGYLRAAFIDITTHSRSQGGSTITQQYVKNALLSNDQSFSRKIKELILSIEIGQFYSKQDILKLYLNEIPYGNGAYGIEAACRTYFSDKYGKDNCAQHLTLSESALLAAIPNAPSFYSPYGQNREALIDRQHLILDKMAQQKYISQSTADGAKWTLAQLDTTGTSYDINKTPSFFSAVTAPNFVYTLQDQLEQKYGTAEVEQGGLKVITTLDPNLQKCAELAIYNPGNDNCQPDGKTDVNPNRNNANYTNLTRSKGSNAALVAANPNNGQVLAMVGSYSFADSQVNVATSPRQPGSSFKPYVYATLFSKNINANCNSNTASCATYGAGSILNDTITEADSFDPNYHPRDFGGSAEVGGPVTIRTALDGSLNIPAVQALSLAGVSNSIATAHSLGITTLNNPASSYGLSLVLGSGEVTLADHVNAYESFANGGFHYAPSMVLKIYDDKNKVIEDNTKPSTPKKVLDPQVAYLINNILSDANARAYVFGTELNVNGHSVGGQAAQGVAVKTGTTEHYNDAWTMGYTPSIVAGVWAGNNDNSPMTSQAADIAAPFWKGFMNAALTGKAVETFPKPSGLQYLTNGGGALQSKYTSDYFPKWYKQPKLNYVTIDKVSGKLATDCTPDLAKEQELDTGITATDDAHSCDDIKPLANIVGLSNSSPGNFSVEVTLGTFGTTKPGIGTAQLQVYSDDQIISTQTVSGSGTYSVPYNPSAGSHTVKAVITDTGLYQGTDEQTVTSSGSSGTFKGLTPSEGSTVLHGSNVNFQWTTDGAAGILYTLWIDGSPRGSATTGTTESFKVNSLGAHNWWVVSSGGDQTPTIDFTAN